MHQPDDTFRGAEGSAGELREEEARVLEVVVGGAAVGGGERETERGEGEGGLGYVDLDADVDAGGGGEGDGVVV